MHQSEGLVLAQCILGNFKFGGEYKTQLFFVIADSTLKEYEIIMLIYNRKNMQVRFTTF